MPIGFSVEMISAYHDVVFIASCLSRYSKIKSAADQDPVLYKIMLFQFFLYDICILGSSVIYHHADPVPLMCCVLLIRI